MKACVIAETSAAARALCAGARGMADEVVLIAPGVEALTGVADKAVHIDVPSGNAIDAAYASVNSVVDAEACLLYTSRCVKETGISIRKHSK